MFSRQTIVAIFIAAIAIIFHVTGSTGPRATANQSVFVLAILIAQITMPRRELRSLLRSRSHTAGSPPTEAAQRA